MNARHVRPEGQPRNLTAPFDPDFSRVLFDLTPDANPLSARNVVDALDQMDGDLFREVRRGPLPPGTAARTTAEILEHLAPRRTPARDVAHGVRQLVGYGLLAVCVLAVSAVAPVLYAVGV